MPGAGATSRSSFRMLTGQDHDHCSCSIPFFCFLLFPFLLFSAFLCSFCIFLCSLFSNSLFSLISTHLVYMYFQCVRTVFVLFSTFLAVFYILPLFSTSFSSLFFPFPVWYPSLFYTVCLYFLFYLSLLSWCFLLCNFTLLSCFLSALFILFSALNISSLILVKIFVLKGAQAWDIRDWFFLHKLGLYG